MTLLGLLNAPAFIGSFIIGVIICYFSNPPPDVVVKFPTPHSAGKIMYRDASDSCFKYRAEKHACPLDKSKVREQPIAEE